MDTANVNSPPMHWHPRTMIAAGRELHALRNATKPPPTAASTAEKLNSYLTSANSLKLLHRFVDFRQPGLSRVPLPDGTNIVGSSTGDYQNSLVHEWMFRRIFIRFLHLPGLWISGANSKDWFTGFAHLYGVSRCLLELELERCRERNTTVGYEEYPIDLDGPDGDSLSWIKLSRNKIEHILNEVAKIAYDEHQTISSRFFPGRAPPSELTAEEMVRRNLSPKFVPIMLDKMVKVCYRN